MRPYVNYFNHLFNFISFKYDPFCEACTKKYDCSASTDKVYIVCYVDVEAYRTGEAWAWEASGLMQLW